MAETKARMDKAMEDSRMFRRIQAIRDSILVLAPPLVGGDPLAALVSSERRLLKEGTLFKVGRVFGYRTKGRRWSTVRLISLANDPTRCSQKNQGLPCQDQGVPLVALRQLPPLLLPASRLPQVPSPVPPPPPADGVPDPGTSFLVCIHPRPIKTMYTCVCVHPASPTRPD